MAAVKYYEERRWFAKTRCLNKAEIVMLLDLAVARGIPRRWLARRLPLYPWIARRFEGEELVAAQLLDRRPGSDRGLTYLGPLVSRRGAYLPLFHDLVRHMVDGGQALWCAAEIESPRVFKSLAALLPTQSFPGHHSHITPSTARRTLESFTRQFKHIAAYDSEHFTSCITDPLSGASHYRLALFGWDGNPFQRQRLLGEISEDSSSWQGRVWRSRGGGDADGSPVLCPDS